MRTAPLDIFNKTIPAGDMIKCQTPGSMIYIVGATDVFRMQFDSGSVFKCQSQFRFNLEPLTFDTVTFYNDTANDIVIQFYVGQMGVTYLGAIEQRIAATYMKGNLGIKDATGAGFFTAGYVSGVLKPIALGSGYIVGDILTVNGGTATQAATLIVKQADSLGRVLQIAVQSGGSYTVNPTNTNAPTGGHGSGFTVNLSYVAPVNGLSFSNGSLVLAAGNSLPVPNFDGSKRRKQIVWSVPSTSAANLQVYDANGNLFLTVAKGLTITMETSGYHTLKSDSANNAVTFTVGQVYYNQ